MKKKIKTTSEEDLQSIYNLPAEIGIHEYDIAIEDGQMKIDFTNIVNPEGQDLFSFITKEINKRTLPSHSHTIKLPKEMSIAKSVQIASSGSGKPSTIELNNSWGIIANILYAFTGDSKCFETIYKLYNSGSEAKISVTDEDTINTAAIETDWKTESAGSGSSGAGGFFSGYSWKDIVDQ